MLTTAPTASPKTKVKLGRRWLPVLVGLALLPLLYLLLIDKVGSHPILVWDEGRLAVNAAEMEQHGHWLVTYFNGQPDMWNTKPPFIIWLEVLSLRLFGYSETAFRLPTMLASVATAGLVYVFVCRRLKSLWGAVLAVGILITATGYNEQHGARTGDYDTVLTLWLVMSVFAFFRYVEGGKPRDFGWAAAALVLAALTKGIAGLFWPPAFLLYALYRHRLRWLLSRPEVYLDTVLGALVVVGYYLAREHYNPGYLQAVSDNELGGRLLGTLNEHLHPWHWFLVNMYEGKFMPWLLVLPVAFYFAWRYAPYLAQRHFTVLAGCIVVFHLLVISSASTKLAWYDTPIYPLMAVIVGLGLAPLISSVVASQYARHGAPAAVGAACLFLLLAFSAPALRIYTRIVGVYTWRHNYPELDYGVHIKSMATQMPGATAYTLYSGLDYNPAMMFYGYMGAGKYHHQVKTIFGPQINELRPEEVVVVCGEADTKAVNAKFTTVVLVSEGPCSTLLLHAR